VQVSVKNRTGYEEALILISFFHVEFEDLLYGELPVELSHLKALVLRPPSVVPAHVLVRVQVVRDSQLLLLVAEAQVTALGVLWVVLVAVGHDLGVFEISIFVTDILLVDLGEDGVGLEPAVVHDLLPVGLFRVTHFDVNFLGLIGCQVVWTRR